MKPLTSPSSAVQVHAEFCVLVRTALPDGGGHIEWREISITNRVNVQVR